MTCNGAIGGGEKKLFFLGGGEGLRLQAAFCSVSSWIAFRITLLRREGKISGDSELLRRKGVGCCWKSMEQKFERSV